MNDWLNKYKDDAKSTAIYKHDLYPYLGLMEELGELCGLYKRVLRDDRAIEEEDLVLELGDLLWYLTILADKEGVALYANTDLRYLGPKTPSTLCYLLSCTVCVMVGKAQYTPYNFTNALSLINALAATVGKDIEYVAAKNIEKLASRKERGALHGKGSNR